jgi:zinc protease
MKKEFILFCVGVLMMAGTLQVQGKLIPKDWTTGRGTIVWLANRPSLPFVVMKVLIKAGSVYDTDEKAGEAYLLSRLLPEGAGGMTGLQISQTLDFMGSDLDTTCGKDYAALTLVTLKEHLEESFKILALVLTQPTLSKDEFDRIKREVVGELLKEEEDPGLVASRAFDEALFKGYPYHRPEKGYVKTVEALTLKDVRGFYERFYHPNFAIFSVAGDVTQDELRSLMDKYLRDWKPLEHPLPSLSDPLPLPEGGETILEKGVTQANIILGHLGVKRGDPDFVKVYVMNQILGGGGLTSRLFQKIREEGGFSYSIYSYYQPTYWRGAFRVVLQTKNERAQEAIKEVRKVLKEYRDKGPSREELEDAKRYLTGSFPLKLDANQEITDYMAFAAFYGLGTRYFVEFPQEIQGVTLKEVKEAAKKYLHPEKLLVVVVKASSSP